MVISMGDLDIKRGPWCDAERRHAFTSFHGLDLRQQDVLFPRDRLESLLEVVLRPEHRFDLTLSLTVPA
jgi:hypothetical protein